MSLANIDLKLKYDARKEILYARWPEFGPYMTQHLEQPFTDIINAIIKLNAKKFIFDVSHCKNKYSDKEFKQVIELLVSGFSQTQLKKLARIKRSDPVYATKFETYFNELSAEMGLHVKFKNFENKEAALLWLEEED